MLNPRRDALAALKTAIRAVDPASLITQTVKLHGTDLVAGRVRLDLSNYRRILVIGGGKASLGMVSGIERVLGDWITDGTVAALEHPTLKYSSGRISFTPSTHPFPSSKGVIGVKKMLSMIGTPDSKDLVVCLVSGGASAMMPLPAKGITISEKRTITEMLVASGASIGEVNIVRRHLSKIKGGRLAERLFPAKVLSLIISDVIDNRPEDIGSGLTAPDPSTYSDAKRVLDKYGLWEKIPAAARRIIRKGAIGSIPDTPKPGLKVFQRVFNIIVGDNGIACQAAAESLRTKGYRTIILTQKLGGEARQAGHFFSAILSGIDEDRFPLGRPTALVAGGETTVVVRGKGRGGRNQELVLSASQGIAGMRNVVVASIGTDGVDGRTDAAGAIADGTTIEHGLAEGMVAGEYLDNNDSYNFFRKLNDLIMTGPTGTNVNDITIALAGEGRPRKPSRRHNTRFS